jgi:hypothetical protein
VQKFLPDGWQPDVVTAGPAKDVNLRVTFIDTRTRRARRSSRFGSLISASRRK